MPPNNVLPTYGNDKTMNLNTMILTNIQASPYFKVQLYELKTYHQVIDEIYTRVNHLEPWEKGSRKTAGQTGMCGGVRGVGAGGIVSSCFCLLYKLYTLKLTRKQLVGLMSHTDSPFIRGIGFMYARFTQPPQDLWDWFEPYMDDEEEVDVKAGGGHVMTMGEMARHLLTKLDWYSTLFPRIPVPIQKQIEQSLLAYKHSQAKQQPVSRPLAAAQDDDDDDDDDRMERSRPETRELPYDPRDASRAYGDTRRSPPNRDRERRRSRSPVVGRNSHTSTTDSSSSKRRSRSPDRHSRSRHRSRSGDRHAHQSSGQRRSAERDRRRSPDTKKHSRHERHRSAERDRSRHNDGRSKSGEKSRHRSRSKEGHKHRSRDHETTDTRHSRDDEYQRDLHKELERVHKSKSVEQNGD